MSLPPPPPGGTPPPPPPYQSGPYQQPAPPPSYGQPAPSYGQPAQFPVYGQPAPTRPVSPALAGLVLVCALAIGVGSVLDWATLTAGGEDTFGIGTISQKGLDADGKVTIVLAVIIGAFAVVALTTRKAWTMIVCAAICAVTALIGVADVSDVKNSLEGSEGFEFDVAVGIGLWIVLIGAIAGTVVAFIGIFARPKAIT